MGLVTTLGIVVIAWLLSTVVDGVSHFWVPFTKVPTGLLWFLLVAGLGWLIRP